MWSGGEVTRNLSALLAAALLNAVAIAQSQPATSKPVVSGGGGDWIAISNGYTKLLTDVAFQHHPEAASWQGLSEYDNKVSQPTLADENQERQQNEAVLLKLEAATAQPQQARVAEDLQNMIDRVKLNFRLQDYQRAHEVPFMNASGTVF